MKKIIVIGMALVILCMCVGCGNTNDELIVNAGESKYEAIEAYIDSVYGEEFTGLYYIIDEMTENDINMFQEIFDEPINELGAFVVVLDANENPVTVYAFN